MNSRLAAILRDRPTWIAFGLLVFLSFSVLDQPAPKSQSADERTREFLTRLSKGEHVEVPLGHGVVVPIDPFLADDGTPIDLSGMLDRAVRASPGRLAEAEHKFGPDDPKTIPLRSLRVLTLLAEARKMKAAELAETNLRVALASIIAPAKLKLAAVSDVLLALPDDRVRADLSRLRKIVDRYASKAPGEAIELYAKIGTEQVVGRWHRDAEKSYEAALKLAKATGGNNSSLTTTQSLTSVHLGLSRIAWERRDCDIAISEADAAFALMDKTDPMLQGLRLFLIKQMQPMMTKCVSPEQIELYTRRLLPVQ